MGTRMVTPCQWTVTVVYGVFVAVVVCDVRAEPSCSLGAALQQSYSWEADATEQSYVAT